MRKHDQRRETHRRSEKDSTKGGKQKRNDSGSKETEFERTRARHEEPSQERSRRREPSIARTRASRTELGEEPFEATGTPSRHAVFAEEEEEEEEEREEEDLYHEERPTTMSSARSKNVGKTVRRKSVSQSSRPDEGSSQNRIAESASGREARLSSVGQKFVQIALNDVDGCFEFIKYNRNIQTEPVDNFLDAARVALSSQKHDDVLYARRCIHRAIVLRKVLGEKVAAQDFVNGMKKQNAQVLRDFMQDQDTVYNHLKTKANPDSTAARHGFAANAVPGPHVSQATRQSQTPESRHASIPAPRHQAGVQPSSNAYIEHATDSRARHTSSEADVKLSQELGSLSFKGTTEAPGRHFNQLRSSTLQALDSRYGLHPRGFFMTGRVFEARWHSTSDAMSFSRVTVEQLHQQSVQLSIRRLVVIRDHHDACTCITIRTYGGRGLARPGFSQQDIDAHAIIHMDYEHPTRRPQEPAMRKRPIAVTPAANDQRLSPASRVDFSKPQDFPYDRPVMNIGRVTAASLPYLQRYYNEEQGH